MFKSQTSRHFTEFCHAQVTAKRDEKKTVFPTSSPWPSMSLYPTYILLLCTSPIKFLISLGERLAYIQIFQPKCFQKKTLQSAFLTF